MANTSVGFEAATTGMPLSVAITITLWCRGRRLGNSAGFRQVHSDDVEVDELEAHLFGHAPHEVGLGDHLLVGQDSGDGLAGQMVLFEYRAHVVERDAATVDQHLGQRWEHGSRAIPIEA